MMHSLALPHLQARTIEAALLDAQAIGNAIAHNQFHFVYIDDHPELSRCTSTVGTLRELIARIETRLCYSDTHNQVLGAYDAEDWLTIIRRMDATDRLAVDIIALSRPIRVRLVRAQDIPRGRIHTQDALDLLDQLKH